MKKFLLNIKGVAAVEFALTVGLFFAVFFMNFEFSRLAITSGYLDLGIAQSVRVARNTQSIDISGNFEKSFRENLQKYLNTPQDTVMRFFLYTSKTDLTVKNKDNLEVKYVDCNSNNLNCIKQLISGKFLSDKVIQSDGTTVDQTGGGVALALYDLKFYNFDFDASLPFLPSSWVTNSLSRKFIMVQEYEK